MVSNWVRIIADPRKPGVLTYECEHGHQWDVAVKNEAGNCPKCAYDPEDEREPDVK